MLIAITVLFIIGYLAIALEHPLRIDKTATALLLGMTLWVLYAFGAETIVPAVSGEELKELSPPPRLPCNKSRWPGSASSLFSM